MLRTRKPPQANQAKPIVLDGHRLSIHDVIAVATRDGKVTIDAGALTRTGRAHQLLLYAASEGLPIYGLNRGVGLNKDKKILREGAIDSDVNEQSTQFNLALLRSHSAAVGPMASDAIVRAAMLVRANTILLGHSGAQAKVAQLLVSLLNHGIHPQVPSRGSIGEADINLLSHVGLALCGEGKVRVEQGLVDAMVAINAIGETPLRPYAKDGLSILSSNAFTAGRGALVLHDVEATLRSAELIGALSLEGLNGNVAPLLPDVVRLRGYEGLQISAQRTRDYLAGSYLWEDGERVLQDPLSFRSQAHVHGAAFEILTETKRKLEIQLNSTDDNPLVLLDARAAKDTPAMVRRNIVAPPAGKQYLFGAVIPTANFEPLPWVLSMQSLGVALCHVSSCSVQRMARLGTEHFSKLSRFLAPNEATIAFGALQKAPLALAVEIRALANPVSADTYPVAGDIEDQASNAPLVVTRIHKIVDNLLYILGMELMHACQAVDLRNRLIRSDKGKELVLGVATERLFAAYRQAVPFYSEDRALSPDIEASYRFVSNDMPAHLAKAERPRSVPSRVRDESKTPSSEGSHEPPRRDGCALTPVDHEPNLGDPDTVTVRLQRRPMST